MGTDPTVGRPVIWFYRNPAQNCDFTFHERYATDTMTPSKHSETLAELLDQAGTCCGRAGVSVAPTVDATPDAISSRGFQQPTSTAARGTVDPRCPLLVDVRTQSEWDAGHASCAHRLEIHEDQQGEIILELSKLAQDDKSYPVHIYCRSGNRAQDAKQVLEKDGWTNIIVEGQTDGWSVDSAAIQAVCTCERNGEPTSNAGAAWHCPVLA